jgi:hypothetical protein
MQSAKPTGNQKTMSDTPKFTVIDRRKIKADEEQEASRAPAATRRPRHDAG